MAGDNDWVWFHATAGAQYTIETSNLGSSSDTYMYLYDHNGTTILAQNDDGGEGLASRIVWTAPEGGTYFVRVRHYDSSRYGPNTRYDLSVRATASSSADSYEPDNNASQARSISTDGSRQTHNFHVAGDNDWVWFHATAGTQYTIETSNLGSSSDTYMYLYDHDGTTILAQDDDGGEGLASRIVWAAPGDGTYYVRVRHYDSSRYGPNTRYDLSVRATASSSADSYEPDNNASQARSISTDGSRQTHNFHVAGDNDWVWFHATAGTQYTIETSNLGSSSDTYMYLYDHDGTTILAQDDDGGEGLASRIVWAAPGDGTYYVRVQHYDSSQYGPDTQYDLSVHSNMVFQESEGSIFLKAPHKSITPGESLSIAVCALLPSEAKHVKFEVSGKGNETYRISPILGKLSQGQDADAIIMNLQEESSESSGNTTLLSFTFTQPLENREATCLFTMDVTAGDMPPGTKIVFTIHGNLDAGTSEKSLGSVTHIISVEESKPKIDRIEPDRIVTGQSTMVSIWGSGFIDKPTVLLDDMVMDEVEFVKSDHLRIKIPATIKPGTYKVIVENPDGGLATLSEGLTVVSADDTSSQIFLPLQQQH